MDYEDAVQELYPAIHVCCGWPIDKEHKIHDMGMRSETA